MRSATAALTYDVFLSHVHADGPFVEEIAQQLSEQGFRVWFDDWELVPGAPADEAIHAALAQSRVFAACIGAERTVWSDRELGAAVAAQATRPDLRTIAILLPDATVDDVPAAIADTAPIDLRLGATAETMGPLLDAISAARRGPGQTDTEEAADGGLSQVDYLRAIDDADATLADDPNDADALRRRVLASTALGRYEQAVADMDRLIAIQPDEFGLYAQKVTALVALGETEAASDVARLLDQRASEFVDQLAETYVGLDPAQVQSIGEDLAGAIEHASRYAFQRLVTALKSDRELAIRRVRCEAALIGAQAATAGGRQESALQFWRLAVELDPDSVVCGVGLMTAVGRTGDDAALTQLVADLETAGDAPAALAGRALARVAQGDSGEALELLDRAVAIDAMDPSLRVMRSNLLIQLGRLAEAADDLRVALDDNPSDWKRLVRLMALYRHLGRLDDVADLTDIMADNLEPALRSLFRKPGDADATPEFLGRRTSMEDARAQHRVIAASLRAKARWIRGERREALEHAFATVREWPRQYAAWVGALELLAKAPQLGEMDTEGVEPPWVGELWRACVVWAQLRFADAIALFSEVIEGRPNLGVAYFLRGSASADTGDARAALEDIERSVEIDPGAPVARMGRANARAALGQLADALEDYDYVIDVMKAGGQAELQFRRGEARRQSGLYREAIEDFDTALRMPMDKPLLGPVIVASRGQAKLGLADLDGALRDLDAALNSDEKPELAWALASRAFVHLARRDIDAAIADRKAYVTLLPKDPNGWVLYGQLLLDTGKAERLWRDLSEAFAAIDEPQQSLVALRAQAAMDSGRHVDAEEIYEGLRALEPEEDWYVYEAARAVRHQGRSDDAATLVEEALECNRRRTWEPEEPLASRFNRCLYLLASAGDDEAQRSYTELLAGLDDPAAARTGMRELDELEASGYWSDAAEGVRDALRAWIDAHASASDSV